MHTLNCLHWQLVTQVTQDGCCKQYRLCTYAKSLENTWLVQNLFQGITLWVGNGLISSILGHSSTASS